MYFKVNEELTIKDKGKKYDIKIVGVNPRDLTYKCEGLPKPYKYISQSCLLDWAISDLAYYDDKKREFVYYDRDGVKTITKVHKDDTCDPYIGVALAEAYKKFNGKKAFKKYVDEIYKKGKR